MATTLCIDWGNTRIKAAIFNDDKLVVTQNISSQEVDTAIAQLIKIHHPNGAIVSAVAGNDANVMMTIREQVPHVIKLDNNTSLPIMNAYSSPESLGGDRLAMAAGAQATFPNCNVLAISLGTCITYNFVQSNKAFRGGAISPGLQMRLRAMKDYTDRLPEVALEGEVILLGYDTDTSIRSGAVNGMAAEIDGMIAAFAERYTEFNAVLTGGDAPFFGNKLKSKIFADPDLLMKGLNLILKHNVPQLR